MLCTPAPWITEHSLAHDALLWNGRPPSKNPAWACRGGVKLRAVFRFLGARACKLGAEALLPPYDLALSDVFNQI